MYRYIDVNASVKTISELIVHCR